MSSYDDLRHAAESAIDNENCDRFIERDDAQAILNLLREREFMRETLALCKEWHKGDKWRDMGRSQMAAWTSHNERLDEALSLGEGE